MTIDAAAIVQRAREQGIRLAVVGDRIRYFPKSGTPGEFVDLLRDNKAEVVAYLSGNAEDVMRTRRSL